MEVRVQNGEPVVDLIDAEGNVHPCLYKRVAWACNEHGYRIKDEKQYAAAQKIISGIAEPGEMLKPARVEEDGSVAPETAKPGATVKPKGKKKPGDDEELESDDVAVVPVG